MRRRWFAIICAVVVALIALVLYGLSRPIEDRFGGPDGSVLWSDTVKRGEMVVLVRGLGVVVHEDNSSMLIARAKIPEFQALEVVAGQAAELDVRLKTGPVLGHVARIASSSSNELRDVDISFDHPLPNSVEGGTSLDATITIGKLHNVLYIGRPVHGEQFQTVSMFRYSDDGRQAIRVNVKFGRASINTMQILDGLKLGDKVILSDMSTWNDTDRIQIK